MDGREAEGKEAGRRTAMDENGPTTTNVLELSFEEQYRSISDKIISAERRCAFQQPKRKREEWRRRWW